MTLQTDLQAAVAKTTAAADKLHQVVHGDSASTVETENGPVKTVSKTIADNEAAIAASRAELNQKAADAAASADVATASATSAAGFAAAAQAAAAAGMFSAVQDRNGPFAVGEADAGDLFRIDTSGGTVPIALPPISSLPAAVRDGFKIAIVKWSGDANAVTVQAGGTDTINGQGSQPLSIQYQTVVFVADAETGQWLAADISYGDTLRKDQNLADVPDKAMARANLGLALGADVQPYDPDIVMANASRNLAAGFTATSHNIGNSGTGTITPLIANGQFQHMTIDGSFTLAPPSDTGQGYIEIEATVDAVGGYTVTVSGFNQPNGSIVTTANKVNLLRIAKHASGTSYLEVLQKA